MSNKNDFDYSENIDEILSFNYKITPEARKLLARPSGVLLEGNARENIANSEKWFEENVRSKNKDYKIIMVGDVVTEVILASENLSRHVKAAFIDGITKRKQFDHGAKDKLRLLSRTIKIDNPAGTIQADAVLNISKILNKEESVLFEIIGEEDLLVIPLVLLLDENYYIIYGQPPITDVGTSIPAGMVILNPTIELKQKIMEILASFEKI